MLKRLLWGSVILVIGCNIFAQTTGKIRGKVIDKSTGEPLPFANVIIEGTTIGAATDLNGEYIIVNVPVEIYTLVASMMGYSSMKVEDVKISVGMTTTINFKLEPTMIKGKEVKFWKLSEQKTVPLLKV